MATLAIDNDELYANLGLVLGVRNYSVWPTELQEDADRIIRAGRRKMFMAHPWSFLEDDYSIVTTPSSSVTGSCANGVITVTSGSIPSSMAGNYKVSPDDDGGLYDVSTQGAGSITLVDNSAANDFTSQTITLYKYRYALPSNFNAFVDPIVVENWENGEQLNEYASLPEFQIRGTLNKVNTKIGPPEIFALTHDVTAETGDFSPYILMYPLMEDAYVLKTRIRILPGDSLAEVGAVFHPVFSELLQEAILAQAEIMFGKTPAIHAQLFAELLPLAIRQDRRMKGTRSLLPRDIARSDAALSRLAIRRAEIDLSGALTP